MDYERLKKLSETDKSIVYLVFDPQRQKMLVEKHIKGEIEVYQRLAECSHPYLPKIESVRIEQGKTVIVEEYIPGGSLAQIRADERQLSRWLLELCEVLDFLHSRQIIHRDIKPSNLLIGADGHIRLIDFDAAREQKETAENDTRLLGTKGYAPPEQYGFAQTDQRADIYAVGVTWKTLLGDRAEVPSYRAVLKKCTDLNPKKRYDSAKKLAFAWRTRTIRRFLPWVIAASAIISVVVGWFWYQSVLPEITESRYPEEELLFYAAYGDYIAAGLDELRESGRLYTMELDLDGDREKETIRLSAKADGSAQAILEDNGREELDLFELVLDTVPLMHYMDHLASSSDDVSYWSAREDDLLQITCLDLDKNGSAEILVSVGDREKHTVTCVFQWNGATFYERGYMWGSSNLKLKSDGMIEGILLPNVYAERIQYTFDGAVVSLSLVDYDKYWNGLEFGVSFEEYMDMIGETVPPADDDEQTVEYRSALAFLDAQMYQSAINVLVKLGDFQNSEALLRYAEMMLYRKEEMPSEEKLMNERYYQAVLVLEQGDYPLAVKLFGELDGYMDSNHQRALAYEQVVCGLLNGTLTFVDTQTRDAAAKIYDNPAVPGEPYLMALVDFDGDGLKELVIEYDGDGDRLILHLMDGVVRGYCASYREMQTIKDNGSFDFSSGADSSGVAMCYFTEWYRQTVVVMEADGVAQRWILNDIEITEDLYYNVAMPEFHKMADVQWLTVENMKKLMKLTEK